MSVIERRIRYFETAGKHNTDTLLKIVKDYIEKENILDVVVASTTGETGVKASKVFKECNVVIVTHHFGFREPGKIELTDKCRTEILANGAKIFTGTHALSGVERAIRKNFGSIQPLEIIANTLRLLGEGVKVCVEIALMAVDAGLVAADRDLVTVAGTGKGADTALRIRPANTKMFFDLKIKEVIAKPQAF